MKRPAPSPMSNEARNSYVIEQITRALTGLLRAKPIGEVSISELCAAAGVGRASFYRNFDSKEAVLQRQDEALLRRWQRDYDTAKARALTEGREPDNLMVSLLMFYKENRDFYTLVYASCWTPSSRSAARSRRTPTPRPMPRLSSPTASTEPSASGSAGG